MYSELKRFSEMYLDTPVLMISRGSNEDNQNVIKETGLNFPFLTWEDDVTEEYQVPGTPFFFLTDEEGLISNAGFATTLSQL
jgi:peroxiredoxin